MRITSFTFWRLALVPSVLWAWTLAPPSPVPLAAPPLVSYSKDDIGTSVSAEEWKTFIAPGGDIS